MQLNSPRAGMTLTVFRLAVACRMLSGNCSPLNETHNEKQKSALHYFIFNMVYLYLLIPTQLFYSITILDAFYVSKRW